MNRLQSALAWAALIVACLAAGGASAQPVTLLGTAASYGVLAGSAITNTGPSVIDGDIGVSPGTAMGDFTGLPNGLVNGTQHSNDAAAIQAKIDLVTAYNSLVGRITTMDLTGTDLGGLVLTPGVYTFSSSAALTGLPLTLDAQGNPNALFVFQIGSTLTTASASSIVLANQAQGGNVFFQVGTSAVLGTTTAFVGQILALSDITLNTGANILCGAALARNGAVTLDDNHIGICTLTSATFGTVLGPTSTANQAAVAAALDAFVAGGGILPPAFQNLLDFLSPEELAAAFSQLSGEAGTDVSPAGRQAMDSYLSLLDRRLADIDDRSGNSAETVRALGYAGERQMPAPLASFDKTGAAADLGRWSVWGSFYGGQNTVAGDATIGSHDTTTSTFGLAAGFDQRVTPATRAGFSIAASGANFGVANGLGGGHSDILQAGVYGRTNFGAAYVTAAAAYGWNGVTTDRYVTLLGVTDHLTARFSAQNVGAEIEAGYRLKWLTPYAALRGQVFYTPAYSETPAAGSSANYALNYQAHTTYEFRTELGARFAASRPLPDGTVVTLNGRLAWAHTFVSDQSMVAGFQALPGSMFTVQGANPTADSLLVSAGAEFGFKNGVSLAGLFDGEFASNAQTYSGTARVRYSW